MTTDADKITAIETDLASLRGQMSTMFALSPDEFGHAKSLDETERKKFFALDRTARAAEVAKAAESNAVVYTDLDGNAFRKSDDPRLVAAAKRADVATTEAAAARLEKDNAVIEKRAAAELGTCKGTITTKAFILGAVERALDVIDKADKAKGTEMRTAVKEFFASANRLGKSVTERKGVDGPAGDGAPEETDKSDDPHTALADYVTEKAKTMGPNGGPVPYSKALASLTANDPKARDLWEKSQNERRKSENVGARH